MLLDLITVEMYKERKIQNSSLCTFLYPVIFSLLGTNIIFSAIFSTSIRAILMSFLFSGLYACLFFMLAFLGLLILKGVMIIVWL
jgi:hypothetical protein